jgi:hypothetical protein
MFKTNTNKTAHLYTSRRLKRLDIFISGPTKERRTKVFKAYKIKNIRKITNEEPNTLKTRNLPLAMEETTKR